MKYFDTIPLKDGRICTLRHGTERDAEAVLEIFIRAHGQTDYLLTYPDEVTFTVGQEAEFLKRKAESPDEIEILAEIDGVIVGTGGLERVGRQEKLRHRAEFGVSIDKAHWGLGVGRALTEANIACAKAAGYLQLELGVVAENARAVALYESLGFTEYGRNPKGFRSRLGGWQEVILMRKELSE